MYIVSTKARARKHGCSLWQILMCSLFSCCCLLQKCLELYIFEVDKLLLFVKGKKLSKQISFIKKSFQKDLFLQITLQLSATKYVVILKTISTNILNTQARGKLFLILWFSIVVRWFDFWWKKVWIKFQNPGFQFEPLKPKLLLLYFAKRI